jgi:anti-sigma factor RsiW
MRCEEFLARYSEFVDGLLMPSDAERLRAHLAACARCLRYDRVYRRGVALLASEAQFEPGPSFFDQLHYRIASEDQRALQPISTSVATAVTIAAVLAVLVWAPAMLVSRTNTEVAMLSAALDSATNEIAWHGGHAVADATPREAAPQPESWLTQTSAAVSLIDRGYSPLILESPTEPPAYARVSFTSLETR